MKPAFQKDEALIADLRKALNEGRDRLWWLGQSGFALSHKGRLALLDPYLSDSLTTKYQETDKPHVRITERVVAPEALAKLGSIDCISSSHAHTDHLDRDTLLPLLSANPLCRFIVPSATRDVVLERVGPGNASRLVELDSGKSVRAGEFVFEGVPAAHNTIERDVYGHCRHLGYVVSFGNKRLYHSGDTLRYGGMEELLRTFHVDVALVPINGNLPERRVAGNLNGLEAARLAKAIGAGLVIPCHYDMFEFNTASPDEFARECRQLEQPYCVLRNGEGVDL